MSNVDLPTDASGQQSNRYAEDWNSYSKTWDSEYGTQYTHLGDEWNDDQTQARKRDAYYFSAYADRWIAPNMTVLEIGPGGGKWTVQIAPKVKRLIVLDVAQEMLNRTRSRCEALGITNVEYVLGNGKDFQPIGDASIDFFFSYDVFVHIALEDTWVYAQEMARVLVPGGHGTCHYAINSVPEAWDRIEENNEWYRGGAHTLGQFYYYSGEALRRMFERCGLSVREQHQEGWHCTCIFAKPAASNLLKLAEVNGDWRQLAQQHEQALREKQAWIAELEQSQRYWQAEAEQRAAWIAELEQSQRYWQAEAEQRAAYLKRLEANRAFRIISKLGLLSDVARSDAS